ncbi:hypothetical protein ACFQ3P_42410 [Paraburkholderia sabiae]|uniref:Uncharacterized protein n=1 Tax=Paraburkholderia sabiae TaxID=273251 RepID=A0ABU9QTK5_9BURK|nr:hypothetical protein [Paraburkholderia sabiae]WJZ79590.1 hypothetical protein QEN71_40635 [Paraburkholderia sabiae]CAD6563352.1 hypothetical protein LMG24235_08596 [Paraburkholderia sabiae]
MLPELLSEAMCEPSLSMAKRSIPTSTPIALVAVGKGTLTSRCVWMLAKHFSPDRLTVTLRTSPSTGRLLR